MADTGDGLMDWVLASWTPESISTALLAAFFVSVLLVCYHAQVQKRRRLPPGPWPWPVIGNFLALAGDMPHREMQKLAAKYGGLMYLRLGMCTLSIFRTRSDLLRPIWFRMRDGVAMDDEVVDRQ